MLTKEEIINLEPQFLEIFNSDVDVYREFEEFGYKNYVKEDEGIYPDFIKILFAFYEYQDYSGDAFVLYYDTRDKKLYEVHGGHCSCYGLEGQWNPEECSLEGLEFRLKNGKFNYNHYQELLKQFLKVE